MIQTAIIIVVSIAFLIIYHFAIKNPMSQQEKVIEAFERFVGVNILYQTFDGELFVELPDAQAYGIGLLSQAIINIPRPFTIPDEVLPSEGKWVYLPHGANNILQDNLIVNGFGELGDSSNFSQFNREPFVNQFSQGYSVTGKVMVTTDALIPIDFQSIY